MNILMVNYEYPPIGAGAATATLNMANEMAREGHFVGVLTSSYRELKAEIIEGQVNVFRCRSLRKKKFQSNVFEMLVFMVSASFSVGKLIRRWKINKIIVFFSFPCGPVGLTGRIFFKIPYVVSLRGGDVPGAEKGLKLFHFILTPLRRLILSKSISVIANSVSLMQLASKTDRFDYKVIPNGVDTDYFFPDASKKSSDRFEFLFTGRLQPQKNLFYLFDRIAEVKNECNSPFVLKIVGDGYLRSELENYAGKIGIKDHIEFYGWLSKEELREFYQKADCLVNPSLYEGMSNVVMEAMACGLPVLASKVTGNDELVLNDVTGYLIDLENKEAFNSGLISAIHNKEQIGQLGVNARQRVVEKYSWKEVSKAYLKILNTGQNEDE